MPSPATVSPGPHDSLHPGTLGLFKGTALYVSAILGAGILLIPGQAATLAGPASLLAWAFILCISVPLASTFATLGTRYPDPGGSAAYVGRIFGDLGYGVVGWWFVVAATIGQAVVPLTAGFYVSSAFSAPSWVAALVGMAIQLFALFLAVSGLRVGGSVQVVITSLICLVLALAILSSLPRIHWDTLGEFAPQGVAGIGAAVVVLFYAVSGWEAMAHLADDFLDVRRTVPGATGLTLVIVSVLFLGLAVAVVGTGSYGTPEQDRTALASLFGDLPGLEPAVLVAVAALVICTGTTSAFLASLARLMAALAQRGWAPRPLGAINLRGAPARAALLITTAAMLVLVLTVTAGQGPEVLVAIPAALVLCTYLLTMFAAARILRGLARAVAWAAFALLLVGVPAMGKDIWVPAALVVAALLWRMVRMRQAPRTR